MRYVVLAVAILIGTQAWSQTALGPPSPAISPPSSLAATPEVSIAPPGTTNSVTANQPATNSVTALAQALVQLQFQLEQILPALASFNNNFDFIDVGGILPTIGVVPEATAPASSSQGVNSGGTTSSSSSTNLLAGTIGLTTTGVTNSVVLTPGFVLPVDTNGFVVFPITRDTLRQLLVLQSDMQRMLPVLSGINTGTGLGFPIGFNTNAGPGFLTGFSTNTGSTFGVMTNQ